MPTKIFQRQHMLAYFQDTDEYKLFLEHVLDHSGSEEDGDATINTLSAGSHYEITCPVREDPGLPSVMASVVHVAKIPNFDPSGDPDGTEYIFDVFVENGGAQLN